MTGIESHRTGPAVLWGLVFGSINAAAPLAFWWLDPSVVHALIVSLIAAVYIGFAVADGRPRVIGVESTVAVAFVVLAMTAASGNPWLLVGAYTAHGFKDLWQHRHHFVAGTRWWPPFCAAVDFLVAAVIVVEIIAGVRFN